MPPSSNRRRASKESAKAPLSTSAFQERRTIALPDAISAAFEAIKEESHRGRLRLTIPVKASGGLPSTSDFMRHALMIGLKRLAEDEIVAELPAVKMALR